ncbi:MAG: FeoB-associated Cys-rich membrane protein [Clostridiales bacterium]|nr:FeoB-associated Cys-rich membrane protein [Clostridiales bacterium]
MGNVIVVLILTAAVTMAVRTIYKNKKNGAGCSCGCGACQNAGHCGRGACQELNSTAKGSEEQKGRI